MATTQNIRTWKRRSRDHSLPVEERVTDGFLRLAREELSGDGLPFGEELSVERREGAEHPSWAYERDA